MTFKIRNKETKLFIQENSGCNKMEDRTFNEEKEANEFLKIFKKHSLWGDYEVVTGRLNNGTLY